MRAKFIRASQLKHSFPIASCVVPISVGQPYHEKEKFEAIVHLINQSKFKSCTIIVCDLLQRHNHHNASEHVLDKKSLEKKMIIAGDQWLSKVDSSIKKLKIPYRIDRWEKWLYHSDFEEKRSIIEQRYLENLEFRNNIHVTIDSYFERMLKRGLDIDFNHAKNQSLKYIFEEMAVELLWIEEKFHFEIYPRSRPASMQAGYKHFIENQHPNLLRRLVPKFIRRIPD